jgi:TetR/AcrR family transcriptional regulator, mexCD-oprJ operon repressor
MPEATTDHRRAIAERNLEAILDAAERLLQAGAQASIAAVAAEAGVSRVTVYAHFATREDLLEAVAERAVRGASAALERAEPASGPPGEALERLIAASWRELDRHDALVRATAQQLPAEARRRSHETYLDAIGRLVERGRREGAFRKDLPAGWLVTCLHALVHAAADDVRAERLEPDAALAALQTTVRDVFMGSGR